jgi:hypothetical protein
LWVVGWGWSVVVVEPLLGSTKRLTKGAVAGLAILRGGGGWCGQTQQAPTREDEHEYFPGTHSAGRNLGGVKLESSYGGVLDWAYFQ